MRPMAEKRRTPLRTCQRACTSARASSRRKEQQPRRRHECRCADRRAMRPNEASATDALRRKKMRYARALLSDKARHWVCPATQQDRQSGEVPGLTCVRRGAPGRS